MRKTCLKGTSYSHTNEMNHWMQRKVLLIHLLFVVETTLNWIHDFHLYHILNNWSTSNVPHSTYHEIPPSQHIPNDTIFTAPSTLFTATSKEFLSHSIYQAIHFLQPQPRDPFPSAHIKLYGRHSSQHPARDPFLTAYIKCYNFTAPSKRSGFPVAYIKWYTHHNTKQENSLSHSTYQVIPSSQHLPIDASHNLTKLPFLP